MFPSVRIVLVHTTHPGNIGGVARAMKNMAFDNLYLVSPKEFPSAKADARASGATDILERAVVVDSLEEAVADCHLVVGASARGRHIPWPVVDPRELAEQVVPDLGKLKVALVFGREDRGLTNEELQRCHRHVHIPSNPDFSSLNLAAAVQVICYELRMAMLAGERTAEERPRWGTEWDIELASADELERLFLHMEQTLIDIDFLDPDNPRQLMPRLRRLYLRSHPDRVEVSVLRGILTATQKILKGNK
ncbi:MAG TPA: tRNA (cytosine(32)/uridine(32)-2'-O)-methyltransferase TrmJ, partial [Motiliproteus sp.]